MTNEFLPKFKLVISLTKEFIYLVVLLLLFFAIMNIWEHLGQPHLWAGALVLFSILSRIAYL